MIRTRRRWSLVLSVVAPLLLATPASLASAQETSVAAQVAPAKPEGRTTLSVNIAIVLLGALWLTLVVRRVQMHRAAEPRRFTDAGPQPAASGR